MLEVDGRKRWQAQIDGMRAVAPRNSLGIYAAEIAHVGPAILLRVGVHDFPVEARFRNAHAIVFTKHGRVVLADLETKLIDFQQYYNEHRTHAGLD